jgi:hypothetical protein
MENLMKNCIDCGDAFAPTNNTQKRCISCAPKARAASNKKWKQANKAKVAQANRLWSQNNRDKMNAYKKHHYDTVTAPKGIRLSERLVSLMHAQGRTDPSRLPELASRVLEWSPKGFTAAAKYAKHPYGPLERDWLYYAEMSPEEAVVVYARED